jgi:Flp pilus assembly protein TadD
MRRLLVPAACLGALLCACGPLPPRAPEGPYGQGPGTAQPAPGAPAPPAAPPAAPNAPAPRQFHLGTAASALVTQAHHQAAGGDYGQATATLERAVRIEPDNPLVWIELGRVCLAEDNGLQADAMGRKALALATGDPAAQAAAWRLIADSLRLRGRNADAAEADRHAAGNAAR